MDESSLNLATLLSVLFSSSSSSSTSSPWNIQVSALARKRTRGYVAVPAGRTEWYNTGWRRAILMMAVADGRTDEECGPPGQRTDHEGDSSLRDTYVCRAVIASQEQTSWPWKKYRSAMAQRARPPLFHPAPPPLHHWNGRQWLWIPSESECQKIEQIAGNRC